jgi:hypothetical protein
MTARCSLPIATFALAASFASAALAEPATWEQYPQLVCRGSAMLNCDLDGACGKQDSTAVWRIDFAAGKVTYATIDVSEDILAKRHIDYGYGIPPTNNMLLSSGRLAVFHVDAGASGAPQITMLTLGASFGKLNTTTFACSTP